jgi:hypothetical protein
MFKKWWRRRQERRAAQERRDAEAIIDARREVEHWDRREDDLSEAAKIPPAYQPTDWGGGPL